MLSTMKRLRASEDTKMTTKAKAKFCMLDEIPDDILETCVYSFLCARTIARLARVSRAHRHKLTLSLLAEQPSFALSKLVPRLPVVRMAFTSPRSLPCAALVDRAPLICKHKAAVHVRVGDLDLLELPFVEVLTTVTALPSLHSLSFIGQDNTGEGKAATIDQLDLPPACLRVLNSLKMLRIDCTNFNLSHDAERALFAACPGLEAVKYTGDYPQLLSEFCPNLRTVDISWCNCDLPLSFARCRSLTALNTASTHFTFRPGDLPASLQDLVLSHPKPIDPTLFVGLPNLRSFTWTDSDTPLETDALVLLLLRLPNTVTDLELCLSLPTADQAFRTVFSLLTEAKILPNLARFVLESPDRPAPDRAARALLKALAAARPKLEFKARQHEYDKLSDDHDERFELMMHEVQERIGLAVDD